MNPDIIDSLLPTEMASKAESLGVDKAKMPLSKTVVLSVLAGAFIAFGSIFIENYLKNTTFDKL